MECPPVFSCLALSSHTVKGKVISVACKVYTTGTPCSSQLYSHLIPLLLSMLLQLCWPPCESPCSIPESWHCCSSAWMLLAQISSCLTLSSHSYIAPNTVSLVRASLTTCHISALPTPSPDEFFPYHISLLIHCACVPSHISHVTLCSTPWSYPTRLLCPRGSSR